MTSAAARAEQLASSSLIQSKATVRLITELTEFAQLRARWEKLFASNPAHLPYQSWNWNYTWWKHHGRTGDLRLFVVERAGELIGIAPWYVSRRFRGLRLRHLRCIGHKRADYVDFPVRAGCEEPFFRALFAHLGASRGDWHLIEIRDLPASSPNRVPLLKQAADVLCYRARVGEVCVRIALPRTYPEFLRSLSKRFRKDIAYYRRSLEKKFKVEFRSAAEPAQTLEMLKDLTTVYQERWAHKDTATEFDDHLTSAYEREVCRSMSSAGLYRLFMAYANEKPIAGILAYCHNDRCFVERFAHSPEFRKFSVGSVLLAKTIEDGIAEGWRELDLMRGAESYKYRWTGTSLPTTNIVLARGVLMGHLAGMIDRLFIFATRSAVQRPLRGLKNARKGATPRAGTTVGDSGGTPA